jgi:hypothetical protein
VHYLLPELETANKEAKEQYLHIPRPVPKPPVLVVKTEGVSTLVENLIISPYITTQATHSPQFTESHTHEETTSTNEPLPEQVEPKKPSPEQKGHEEPDLEVQFEQVLDIHKELLLPKPIQFTPQFILPAPQQIAPPMAQ